MGAVSCSALLGLLDRYRDLPVIASVRDRLYGSRDGDPAGLVSLYETALPLIEEKIWEAPPQGELLDLYQGAFRELEALIARGGDDERHEFVVVIPVADRPRHLRNCLNSLLELCRRFTYGGLRRGTYAKVGVVVADDSREQGENRRICRQFGSQGLETLHFGLDEQLALLDALGGETRRSLSRIVGEMDPRVFYHKGPSIMRNITCLKLAQLTRERNRPLFWFVDSDQEFRIRVDTPAGGHDLYAINYFHALDRIFSGSRTRVLTGKVVGDPPVSPAVMAGNFLDDVIGFLDRMAEAGPDRPCGFHAAMQEAGDQAAYHDMAALFGFERARDAYQYRCTLEGRHDNAACLDDFAGKLNRFFQGEHPTRKTHYQWEGPITHLRPARTVYTGNYAITPEALHYFIPFATLGLRMAGPTLGRILRAELKDRFASANLPMLHVRTVRETGTAEFRPGVDRGAETVDLSGELERQYFGDVMLFTVKRLTGMGYPATIPDRDTVLQAVAATESDIRHRYRLTRREIVEKSELLRSRVQDRNRWWNQTPSTAAALGCFTKFIRNVEHNFGERSVYFRLTDAETDKRQRLQAIGEAILDYRNDRVAWGKTL